MAKTVHHGGKVGAAGKTLASNSSSKSAKSKAGTTLANHKNSCHKQYGKTAEDYRINADIPYGVIIQRSR